MRVFKFLDDYLNADRCAVDIAGVGSGEVDAANFVEAISDLKA